MASSGTPFLMYHELQRPGEPLVRSDEGYARYCVSEQVFRGHVAWLREQGLAGWSVSQALEPGNIGRPGVAITFDDGCATDRHLAAPALLEAGFGATFFVVSSWVGRRGYLTPPDLRALDSLGFEIGVHSRTHAYLSDLPPVQLRSEIVDAKHELEQWLGRVVVHFSCPGGRWSPAVRDVAAEAGYRTVSTSRPGTVDGTTDPFRLPRTAIQAGTSIAGFERTCRGERRLLRDARMHALSGAKQLLGNALYERLRNAVLRR